MTPTQPPQGVVAERLYAERDHMALDKAGNFYCRHVSAMTREALHGKSDIAGELAWRDWRIAGLLDEVERGQKFREYVVGYFTESDDEAHLSRLDRLWQEVGPEGRQAINVMNESHAALLALCEGLEAALREIAAAFTPRLAEALERWEDEGTAAFADPEYMDAAAIKPLATTAATALAATRTTGDDDFPRYCSTDPTSPYCAD